MERNGCRLHFSLLAVSIFLLFSNLTLSAAQLKQKTVEAWNEYVRLSEERISRELDASGGFLATDFLESNDSRSCKELIRSGGICVLNMKEKGGNDKFEVPDGRIHHWLGTTLIPGAKTAEMTGWIQNYDRHQEIYNDVEESRLVTRQGNFFQIFLRLKRKKIITVHYNTNHDVHYYPQGSDKLYSSSIATRIREISSPGTPDEEEKPEGRDSGFLWRLNSYWRYQDTPEGVLVECESLSLSRDVPALLFMIEGIVDSTAREALQYTLGNLRDGYLQSSKRNTKNAPTKEPTLTASVLSHKWPKYLTGSLLRRRNQRCAQPVSSTYCTGASVAAPCFRAPVFQAGLPESDLLRGVDLVCVSGVEH